MSRESEKFDPRYAITDEDRRIAELDAPHRQAEVAQGRGESFDAGAGDSPSRPSCWCGLPEYHVTGHASKYRSTTPAQRRRS